MDDQPWWETVWGKVQGGVDFVIDDWIGSWSGQTQQPVLGLGGNPYPETTPPSNANPTEKGFTIGNNVPTYLGAAGLLLLGFITYKAVK